MQSLSPKLPLAVARSTLLHAPLRRKEIFVVPGNITSPMSAGCNTLIKQGAHVVTDANDITELQAGLRDGDEIQRKTGLSSTDFNTSLTILEMQGIIRALGANQWTLL
ncbi:MAG TPA: hypothetical protein VLF64_01570 [Candidatus Saccharimonadales bacterium]|nr:hypothetical protein [Candidatus Saccharimonadales bacterium]